MQFIVDIEDSVIESAKKNSEKRGENLTVLVKEYVEELAAAKTPGESLVDRMIALAKTEAKLPLPADWKNFIREERYNDWLNSGQTD